MNRANIQKSVLPSLCRAFGHREGRQKGGSAREWMNVHVGEPSRFDIFSPDGEYAGSLKPPDDIESIRSTSGDKILFRYKPDNNNDDVWRAELYRVR